MTTKHLSKGIFSSALALGWAAYVPSSAHGLTSISPNDTVGDPTHISISPGDSFAIKLQLSATVEQLTGTSYYLVTTGAGSGKFRLVSRNIVGTLFSDLNSLGDISNTLLTGAQTLDLGATLENPTLPTQPGSFFLADYVIASDPTITPGDYFLQTGSNSIATGPAPTYSPIPLSASSYRVTVVPEPGTAALTLAGLGLLAGLRRQRRQESVN